jgi:hypothetical protein
MPVGNCRTADLFDKSKWNSTHFWQIASESNIKVMFQLALAMRLKPH